MWQTDLSDLEAQKYYDSWSIKMGIDEEKIKELIRSVMNEQDEDEEIELESALNNDAANTLCQDAIYGIHKSLDALMSQVSIAMQILEEIPPIDVELDRFYDDAHTLLEQQVWDSLYRSQQALAVFIDESVPQFMRESVSDE